MPLDLDSSPDGVADEHTKFQRGVGAYLPSTGASRWQGKASPACAVQRNADSFLSSTDRGSLLCRLGDSRLLKGDAVRRRSQTLGP